MMRLLLRSRSSLWLVIALGLWLTMGGATACARSRVDTAPASSGTPVDAPLLAFLSRARAAHHSADLLEERGDMRAAIKDLEKITQGPLPPGGLDTPEVREVLADTRARLGDLRSQTGDIEGALREVQAGLTLTPEASYFRGHLLEVEGLVEERRARSAEREAGELLNAAGARLSERKTELKRVQARVAAAERSEREAAPGADLDAARAERTDARAALDRLREAGLTAEERQHHDRLRAEAASARERALAAFVRSMEVQAQVIEANVPGERR